MRHFGQYVAEQREYLGLAVEALGARMEVSADVVRRIEASRSAPLDDLLFATIARGLGVEPRALEVGFDWACAPFGYVEHLPVPADGATRTLKMVSAVLLAAVLGYLACGGGFSGKSDRAPVVKMSGDYPGLAVGEAQAVACAVGPDRTGAVGTESFCVDQELPQKVAGAVEDESVAGAAGGIGAVGAAVDAVVYEYRAVAVEDTAPEMAVGLEPASLGDVRFAGDDAEAGEGEGDRGGRYFEAVGWLSARGAGGGEAERVRGVEEEAEGADVGHVAGLEFEGEGIGPDAAVGHEETGPVGAVLGDAIEGRVVEAVAAAGDGFVADGLAEFAEVVQGVGGVDADGLAGLAERLAGAVEADEAAQVCGREAAAGYGRSKHGVLQSQSESVASSRKSSVASACLGFCKLRTNRSTCSAKCRPSRLSCRYVATKSATSSTVGSASGDWKYTQMRIHRRQMFLGCSDGRRVDMVLPRCVAVPGEAQITSVVDVVYPFQTCLQYNVTGNWGAGSGGALAGGQAVFGAVVEGDDDFRNARGVAGLEPVVDDAGDEVGAGGEIVLIGDAVEFLNVGGRKDGVDGDGLRSRSLGHGCEAMSGGGRGQGAGRERLGCQAGRRGLDGGPHRVTARRMARGQSKSARATNSRAPVARRAEKAMRATRRGSGSGSGIGGLYGARPQGGHGAAKAGGEGEELAEPKQLRDAETLEPKMLNIDTTTAQRRFKDLQIHTQIRERYGDTARKLYG